MSFSRFVTLYDALDLSARADVLAALQRDFPECPRLFRHDNGSAVTTLSSPRHLACALIARFGHDDMGRQTALTHALLPRVTS